MNLRFVVERWFTPTGEARGGPDPVNTGKIGI